MEMKHPIQELFKIFEGDLEGLGLYAYLGSFLTPDRSHLISLREIEKKTGRGRRKLRATLDRLREHGLVSYSVSTNGTKLVLDGSRVCSFSSTKLPKDNTVSDDISEPLGISKKSRIDLTQNLRFLQSDFRSDIGPTNSYRMIHSLDSSLLSSAIGKMIGDKTKLDDKTDPSKAKELQASTEVSSQPADRSLVRDSLSKIPRKEKKAKAKEKEKSLGAQIWDAYANEYEMIYDVIPPSNAINYSITKQLGQRLGADAMEVVRFYCHHKDAFYVKNRHDIRFALNGANRLYIDWKKQASITYSDAKYIENKDRNRRLFESFEDKPSKNELGNMSLID